MPNVRDVICAVVIAVGLLPAIAPSALSAAAPARDQAESIPTYDVVLKVVADGVLHVRETITYDFDSGGEHGIVRRVPYRIKNRLYEIRNVRTSSSTGAPARAKAAKRLHDVKISVGGEHRKVRGRQAYVIEYDVTGAFTLRGHYAELRWDAIGGSWDVPIGEVSVRVETPVPLRKVSCRAGASRGAGDGDLTPCGRDRDGSYAMDFTQSGLNPHESVLIKVLLPEGSVRVAEPRYASGHFEASWIGLLGLAAGLLAAMVLWFLRGNGLGLRSGTALVTAGALLLAVDVGDDVLADGIWAFSIGDLALAGAALILPGVVIVVTARRRGRAEQGASADQRA